MRKKLMSVAMAAVAALASLAFGSAASAHMGEYARFNYCPDDGSDRGGESHRRGPILNWWSQIRLAVGLTPVKCKEISSCYVGSSSPKAVIFQGAKVRLENALLGSTATRQRVFDGVVAIASRAGGGRERAYVAAIDHGCA
jgi:hypothetical protein